MKNKLIEILQAMGRVAFTNDEKADYLLANDVVPVVRCKDCRHCMVEGKRYKSYYCGFHSNEAWGGVYVEPLEYCSCGERVQANEN